MLNQLILTLRLWMGQSPSMLIKAWVASAKLLLGRLNNILAQKGMGGMPLTVRKQTWQKTD